MNNARLPPANAYGSGDDENSGDDGLAALATAIGGPRMGPQAARFMHDLGLSGMLVPMGRPAARRRRAPAAAPDRERDRSPPPAPAAGAPAAAAAVMLPPMAVNEQPSVLCLSDMSRQVDRLLGAGQGMSACFACHFGRANMTTPVARDGLDMMHKLLSSATSGTCRVALALDMSVAFEHYVRTPMNRYRRPDEEQCPAWHVRDIYDHYMTPLHGRLDAVSSQESRAITMERALYNMERYLLYEERDVRGCDGPQLVVREDALKAYISASLHLSHIYTQRPSSLALAAAAAPATTQAPGMVDTRRRLLGPAPRRHT